MTISVNFFINAQATYNDFRSRGGTNVTLVDVDWEIRQTYGSLDPVTHSSEVVGTVATSWEQQGTRRTFQAAASSHKKYEAQHANQIWQSDHRLCSQRRIG